MAQLLKNKLSKLNLCVSHYYRLTFLGAKTFASHRRSKKTDLLENDDAKPFKKKHRSFPLFVNNSLPLAPKLERRPEQKFDYFLVLDFEATCDSPVNLDPQVMLQLIN